MLTAITIKHVDPVPATPAAGILCLLSHVFDYLIVSAAKERSLAALSQQLEIISEKLLFSKSYVS